MSTTTFPDERLSHDDDFASEAGDHGSGRTVCLVIAALTSGGAERVMLALAEWLALHGWRVVLITVDSSTSDFFAVPATVTRCALGVMKPSASLLGGAISNLRRLWLLRCAIRREHPAAVVSFVDRTNVLTLAATFGLAYPVIVSERTDPRHYDPGRVWRALRRITYPRAAAVVVQTERLRQWARGVAGRSDVAVIPNASGVDRPPGDAAHRKPLIVGVGRLIDTKGFDVLIDAFARIAPVHPGWDLMLVGDGPLRDELARRAAARGAQDRVHFMGMRRDVHDILADAEIFALTSRFEGFPNALLEAMALGCAAIACACDSGPAEIVRHDVDGLLVAVDDTQAIAAAMERLIGSAADRARLQQNAVAVRDRFSRPMVFGEWEALLLRHAARIAGPPPHAVHRSAP